MRKETAPERFTPAFLLAEKLLEETGGGAVAIDGRCGSGKTALAAALAGRFGAGVVHMDDFFLPPEAREADWLGTVAGNMDLARLEREVLAPLSAGREAIYRPWRCGEGEYGPPERLAPGGLLVVEGSYSHHPRLRGYCDAAIFLTCAPGEQRRRLAAREGEGLTAFLERWIPLEERYFERLSIPRPGDLVIDTTP